jgi:hypothetical protein
MSEKKNDKPKRRPETAASQIIGFRLPVSVAKAIKVEAARRQVPLNGLLTEMWQLYRESKRAG